MRRNGGMDDDGGAMPPKNEVQAPIGKSKCEEKIICLHSPPAPMDQVYGCKGKCNRHIFGALPMHKK